MKKYMIAMVVMMAGGNAIAMQQQADPIDEIFEGTNPKKAQEARAKAQEFVDNQEKEAAQRFQNVLSYVPPSKAQIEEQNYKEVTENGGVFQFDARPLKNTAIARAMEKFKRENPTESSVQRVIKNGPLTPSETLQKAAEDKFLSELKTNKKTIGKFVEIVEAGNSSKKENVREFLGKDGKKYKILVPRSMELELMALDHDIERAEELTDLREFHLENAEKKKVKLNDSYKEKEEQLKKLEKEIAEQEESQLKGLSNEAQDAKIQPDQANPLAEKKKKLELLKKEMSKISGELNKLFGDIDLLNEEVEKIKKEYKEAVALKAIKDKEFENFIEAEKKKQDGETAKVAQN